MMNRLGPCVPGQARIVVEHSGLKGTIHNLTGALLVGAGVNIFDEETFVDPENPKKSHTKLDVDPSEFTAEEEKYMNALRLVQGVTNVVIASRG